MKKSIFDFDELQDYIEDDYDGVEVFPTDNLSLAGEIYCALHNAILFYCGKDFMVINLDDVETLKFETDKHNGETFKNIRIVSKYKNVDGSPRVSLWEYDGIIKAKQYKEG